MGKTFRPGKTDLMFSQVALKDKTQRTAKCFISFFFTFLFFSFFTTTLGSCRAVLKVNEGGGGCWVAVMMMMMTMMAFTSVLIAERGIKALE